MYEAKNLLQGETSPYLLQHATNPVHWRGWSPQIFEDAAALGRPILLSIGYAACHWCHVMAHESFEDPAIADLMNRLFVNVKVDREERPDVDATYMAALHGLGQQGGWPLTMFLKPDGGPFWGGTYFPPQPRWGMPSFRQVLLGLADAYATQSAAIDQTATALLTLVSPEEHRQPGLEISDRHLDLARQAHLANVDPVLGGFRGAPKFPNWPTFAFLLQESFRVRDEACRKAVEGLLDAMVHGGIYDHLAGGFARYSTDKEWLAPHFEKMLYDNGMLLEALALWQARSPRADIAERIEETVAFLDRALGVTVDGVTQAFAASIDADSEGTEGAFYVWDKSEVDQRLGDAAPLFCTAYDVTAAGNWEGHSILRRVVPPYGAEDESRLAAARAILFEARKTRIPPARDDKVLADWNAYAILGLVRASAVLRRPAWLALADRVFDFIVGTMTTGEGRIAHAWRLGRITAGGLLEDHAAMAQAALALFEATGRPDRLRQATRFAQAALDWFSDGTGGFFMTPSDGTDLPAGRVRNPLDNATPSGLGMIAAVFARLHHLTGEAIWRDHARAALAVQEAPSRPYSAMPVLLAAADLLENATTVVVTHPGHPDAEALIAEARAAPDPATLVMRADTSALPLHHPAYGKATAQSAPAAYVCSGRTCSLPLTEPARLHEALKTRRAGFTEL
ncbi:MAG: thioredoxin domain-containing protein [Acetobacteraceae bacterium]